MTKYEEAYADWFEAQRWAEACDRELRELSKNCRNPGYFCSWEADKRDQAIQDAAQKFRALVALASTPEVADGTP